MIWTGLFNLTQNNEICVDLAASVKLGDIFAHGCAPWQWWGTLEHPRLHCHKSTWSGEEKDRISAKKEGIYVLHVHLMEKKICRGLKVLS